MAGYRFDFIKDTRSSETPQLELARYNASLIRIMTTLPVTLRFNPVRCVHFTDCLSYRQTYHITKATRQITWEALFGIINKLQAPVYKRES